MNHPAFAGIGGHHKQQQRTDEWATPPAVIAALGEFDLDPCAMSKPPFRTAAHYYTRWDNGLIQIWQGRVWLNPPYSVVLLRLFMARMAVHNHGTALIFARTETETFTKYVWQAAAALLFLEGRLCFHKPDGSLALRDNGAPANAGGPSVLCAYGQRDAEILAACGLQGQFVPLQIPRSVLAAAVTTWREALTEWMTGRSGPVRLDELYRAFADHPKAKGKEHYRAKLRQILQQGPFTRVGRGKWVMQ